MRPQSYEKLHEKALSKIRKSGAEGVNMKLVSEFVCLILVMAMLKQVLHCSFDLTKKFRVLLLLGVESDAFADFGEHLRGDAEERGNGV